MLQVVVFAVIFAVALTRVPSRPQAVMIGFCQSLAEVSFKMVALVMLYAPIGIGAAIAVTIGQNGPGVLVGLGKLVLTLYLALIAFVICVMIPVAVAFRVPVATFLRAVREPTLIAFSTLTSEAALPSAMQLMEAIGVPPRIVAFVIPTGYTFNLVGSTLYLAVASLFAAQAGNVPYPTQHAAPADGYPHADEQRHRRRAARCARRVVGSDRDFNLPMQAVAVILGVDAFMDMGRTAINVVGNCLAAAVMARWEGVPLLDNPTVTLDRPEIQAVAAE